MSGLRAWQEEALNLYFESIPQDFTVTATPGAGKTTFALTLASRLMKQHEIDRLVVVVPTDHLRKQWAEAASLFNMPLNPDLDNASSLASHYLGYVTTYPQVARKPLLHAARVDFPKKTLVIFDEVHHAGEGLSWGDGIYQAFSHARKRLSLTGTPFRTRVDERIPFLKYEDQGDEIESTADYTYSYQQALKDGVVRPVMFAAYTGEASWESDAEKASGSLAGLSTQKDEMSAWRTVLHPRGKWVPHVLAAASSRLDEVRESKLMPDAGMLVLASDQDSAREYARILKSITGIEPVVALSDDPQSSARIDEFNRGYQKYLVAVRMVSEGVDVPRLGVLVWLTSYRTPLFFAQAVGRVVRARSRKESATVFLPAVRPLLALASDLEAQRKHVLPKLKDIEDVDEIMVELAEHEKGEGFGFKPLDSQASFGHVLFSGKAVTAEGDYGDFDMDSLGLFAHAPELLSPQEMAALLASRDEDHRRKSEETLKVLDTPSEEERIVKTHEQVMGLRREINLLVNRLAMRTGFKQADIHLAARKQCPGPPNSEANADLLGLRRDWLMSKLS